MTLALDPVVVQTSRSPRGNALTVTTRPSTSDGSLMHQMLVADEYRLGGLQISGWALDLGAHIGGVTMALLVDNPDLHVIAVEPLAENVEVLQANVRSFGPRAHIVQAIAGTRPIGYRYGGIDLPEGYAHDNRYIAGPLRSDDEPVETETVTLQGLLDAYDIDEFAFVKTDCEGGEWEFFSDPSANARIALIRGEFHDDPLCGQRMVDLLSETHDVTILTRGQPVGLFEAVRK